MYLVFELLEMALFTQVRPQLRTIRALSSKHTWGLARYIRFLGFDAVHATDGNDAETAERSAGAIGRSGCGPRLAGEVQVLYTLHGVQWCAGSRG